MKDSSGQTDSNRLTRLFELLIEKLHHLCRNFCLFTFKYLLLEYFKLSVKRLERKTRDFYVENNSVRQVDISFSLS